MDATESLLINIPNLHQKLQQRGVWAAAAGRGSAWTAWRVAANRLFFLHIFLLVFVPFLCVPLITCSLLV